MSTKTVNVLDPQFYVEPWDDYRWLRDNAPAYWDPVQKIWAISRYDDIVAIEKDSARYSSHEGSRPKTDQRSDTSMINKDDPEHQQQRMLVNRRFTPSAIKGHEDHVRRVVTELIDAVAPLGECEAIDALASPLPAIMIGDLLGYPRELWTKVRDWSEKTMYQAGQTPADGVLLLYASANRDERVFTDPDRFDVTRSHNRHVAFGFGTHFCLGASLARLEIRVMFEELLRRIPDWELVDPDEPQVLPATFT